MNVGIRRAYALGVLVAAGLLGVGGGVYNLYLEGKIEKQDKKAVYFYPGQSITDVVSASGDGVRDRYKFLAVMHDHYRNFALAVPPDRYEHLDELEQYSSINLVERDYDFDISEPSADKLRRFPHLSGAKMELTIDNSEKQAVILTGARTEQLQVYETDSRIFVIGQDTHRAFLDD